jgi:hypothetical protein
MIHTLNHVATVQTTSMLPEPTPNARALVIDERSVYVTQLINGNFAWVLGVVL